MYNGCLSDLQSTQLPIVASALVACEVTGLLGLSVLLTVVGCSTFLGAFLVGSEVDASDACARRSMNSNSSW